MSREQNLSNGNQNKRSRGSKIRTIILLMVLILLIVNLIGYILNYDQANRYIGILIDQKRYDQVEIQPHNSAIESHINNEGN